MQTIKKPYGFTPKIKHYIATEIFAKIFFYIYLYYLPRRIYKGPGLLSHEIWHSCWGTTPNCQRTHTHCICLLPETLSLSSLFRLKFPFSFMKFKPFLSVLLQQKYIQWNYDLCDHSKERYWAVLSFGAVYDTVQGGSNFWVCRQNPNVWPFKWKLLSSTFLWCCLSCRTRWF